MTSSHTPVPFQPRALAPYIRAKDAATGTFDREAGVYTIQVNDLGRVTWDKSYDHEDVDAGFTADSTLLWFVNFLASCGVCVLLLLAIGVVAQVPDSWLSWLVLAVEGL